MQELESPKSSSSNRHVIDAWLADICADAGDKVETEINSFCPPEPKRRRLCSRPPSRKASTPISPAKYICYDCRSPLLSLHTNIMPGARPSSPRKNRRPQRPTTPPPPILDSAASTKRGEDDEADGENTPRARSRTTQSVQRRSPEKIKTSRPVGAAASPTRRSSRTNPTARTLPSSASSDNANDNDQILSVQEEEISSIAALRIAPIPNFPLTLPRRGPGLPSPSPSAYTNELAIRGGPASAAASESDAQSENSRTSKRSQSPVKPGDLAFLPEPIDFRTATTSLSLPADVQELWEPLEAICDKEGIIPSAVKDASALINSGERVRDRMLQDDGGTDLNLDPFVELQKVIRIRESTIEAIDRDFHEPAWNESVHSRVLRLAFKPFAQLESLNITTARLHPCFAPKTKAAVVTNKMVDYSVNLVPTAISPDFDAVVHAALHTLSPGVQTVNQTVYEPARTGPAVISIETKTESGGVAEAKFKLGVWMTSWGKRAKELALQQQGLQQRRKPLSSSGGDGATGKGDGKGLREDGWRCITLPGVIVIGAEWNLYFLVDRSGKTDLVQFPHPIGDTRTLLGTYQLLASLRLLGRWGCDDFYNWFTAHVLGLNVGLGTKDA